MHLFHNEMDKAIVEPKDFGQEILQYRFTIEIKTKILNDRAERKGYRLRLRIKIKYEIKINI